MCRSSALLPALCVCVSVCLCLSVSTSLFLVLLSLFHRRERSGGAFHRLFHRFVYLSVEMGSSISKVDSDLLVVGFEPFVSIRHLQVYTRSLSLLGTRSRYNETLQSFFLLSCSVLRLILFTQLKQKTVLTVTYLGDVVRFLNQSRR